MSTTGKVGGYGKLPALGDFVQRRLPAAFVSTWDRHFEAAVDAARGALDARWHALWDAAPIWRFALAPGVCGGTGWIGVTGPSHDRVGRGFPMVLASAVSDADTLQRLVPVGGGWFDALEMACRGAAHAASAEAFDAALLALPDPIDWLGDVSAQSSADTDLTQTPAWHWPWQQAGSDPQLDAALTAALDVGDGCLWWTRGSTFVPPSLLVTRGLPEPAAYAAFLDAQWTPEHWQTQGQFQPRLAVDMPVSTEPGRDAAMGVASGDILDDVLADLLTVPVAGTATAERPLLRDSMAPDASAVASITTAPSAGCVVCHDDGALAWIAADNGSDDPRRHAAMRAADMLGELSSAFDMHALQAHLQALHPSLRERGEDLVNPVDEDAAVLVADLAGEHARLLRVGAASAWHWHDGQLRALFAQTHMPLSAYGDGGGPDDLSDMLSSAPATWAPGLGAADELHCDEITCAVARGDRLALLATETLAGISEETLARSLRADTAGQARARIAAAAGWNTDQTPWPVAVIEVGI